MNDKAYGYIGLAKKAGLLSAGTDSVINSVRAKKSKIVIVAADASEGTMKKVTDKCAYYGVECIVFGTCESVGNAIGKGLTACVSVTDGNLASALKKCICSGKRKD